MEFGEIIAPSIHQLFVSRIEGMILSGKLQPGEKLPTERELAAEMKISKTVVHEGLRELARLGFLDVTSRKGVVVADYARTGNLETLVAISKYNAGRVDRRTAKGILDLRVYLEAPILKQLAACHTDEDIALLREKQQCVRAAMNGDVRTLCLAVFDYHRTMIVLSGNTIIPLIYNAFIEISTVFWTDYISLVGAETLAERLEFFTECIRTGEGERAAKILEEELEAYTEHYEK